MYKAKLQELCQWLKWNLPEYEMKREGPDHSPRFQATIVIDGMTFQSRDTCKSMKLAQNEVAQTALRYLTPSIGSSGSKTVSVNNPSEQRAHLREGTEGVQAPEFSVPVPVVQEHNRTEGFSKTVSENYLSNQLAHLREGTEAVQVPQFSVPVPVAQEHNRTEGSSKSVRVNYPSDQLAHLREGTEAVQVPKFSVPVPIVQEHNRTEGSSKTVSENYLSNQLAHLREGTEAVQVPKFSVPVPVVQEHNRTEGSSKTVSVNYLSDQLARLIEGTEAVRVPKFSVPVPVVQEHNRTEGTSHAISAQTSSIANQQRFQQEVVQVPEFTVSTPVAKDDNQTKAAFLAANLLKSIIASQQRTAEIREVGRIHESNVSNSTVKEDNTTKVSSDVTKESTNNTPSQHILQEQRREPRVVLLSGTPLLSAFSTKKMKDTSHLCKSQLQTYTQKQNLCLPTYIPEREGPPHACRFRCKVVVGEQTFENHVSFTTLREAENAVAKIALAKLAPNASQEEECLVYKNLLQEIAQKRNILLPVYTTARTGPPHSPTFVSAVEVAGEVFNGQEAKTKKLAEMSAAKVAYLSLTGGICRETPSLLLPSQLQEKPHEAFHATPRVGNNSLEIPPVRPRKITPDVPLQWFEVHEEEMLRELGNASFPAENKRDTSPTLENYTGNDTTMSSAGMLRELGNTSFSAEKKFDTSPMLENHTGYDTAVSSADETKNKLIVGACSRRPALGERVVICPWTPGMTLPEGSQLMFRDDEWIAFRHAKP